MIKQIGRATIGFESAVPICSFASVAGKKEAEGPLGANFDYVDTDPFFGEKTWEKAESTIQKQAVQLALEKENLTPEQINCVFAGDLLNQCIASSFGLRDFGIPLLGLYGACSTMAESLCLASIFVAGGAAKCCAAVASSHFCTAERQFRLPLAYGGQRTPTAQWTATAGGCVIVGGAPKHCNVRHVSIGKIVDLGITDANNMGAAMAPAAASTICQFLQDTSTTARDYDLILTGDLGYVGSDLLLELTKGEGYNISAVHNDCGKMLYYRKGQDVHSGGSGCGCSAGVLTSTILPAINRGQYHNVLFVATGALLSPTSTAQGESVPGIAHLVHLQYKEK